MAKLPIWQLMKCLKYDPLSGQIHRIADRYSSNRIGKLAGTYGGRYCLVAVEGKRMTAHIVAWALYYGFYPVSGIDHIDGDKYNNRISNLRMVPQRTNCQNQSIHRAGKLVGVSVRQSGRFYARGRFEGKLRTIGTFDTEIEAHRAYMNRVNQ